MATNTLTPREYLVRKGDAYASKLADDGFLSEREARVYVLHAEMGLSRDAVLDELDIDPGEYDDAITEAAEKIDAVKRTARTLWSQPDDWAKYDVDPIDPSQPEFANELADELADAGTNRWGDVNGAYGRAYRAACERAARDALDHANHPCIVRSKLYLSPDRDSWLDVFAAEWIPDVPHERLRRAHLQALNAVDDSRPHMLRDATLRARVVESSDNDEEEGNTSEAQ